MHTIETIIGCLRSERTKLLDLGIVTNSEGHRIFIEAFGIGLLPEFMREMRNLEKKKQSKNRLSAEYRLADALIHLRLMVRKYPEMECELLVDDELVAGSSFARNSKHGSHRPKLAVSPTCGSHRRTS